MCRAMHLLAVKSLSDQCTIKHSSDKNSLSWIDYICIAMDFNNCRYFIANRCCSFLFCLQYLCASNELCSYIANAYCPMLLPNSFRIKSIILMNFQTWASPTFVQYLQISTTTALVLSPMLTLYIPNIKFNFGSLEIVR